MRLASRGLRGRGRGRKAPRCEDTGAHEHQNKTPALRAGRRNQLTDLVEPPLRGEDGDVTVVAAGGHGGLRESEERGVDAGLPFARVGAFDLRSGPEENS